MPFFQLPGWLNQRKHFSGRFEWSVFARVFEFRINFLQHSFKQKPLWLILTEKRLKHVQMWLNWSFSLQTLPQSTYPLLLASMCNSTLSKLKGSMAFLFWACAKQHPRNLLSYHSSVFFLLCLNRSVKLQAKWIGFRVSEVNSPCIRDLLFFLLLKTKIS